MAQFIPFDDNAMVNGSTVMATINAFPKFMREVGVEMLQNNGIDHLTDDGWYPQKKWLDTFKEISIKFGENTLFQIGKSIPDSAKFPPNMNTLEEAFNLLSVAYQMNHKDGDIGVFEVHSIDEEKKEIIFYCKNPYPCDFDRGVLTAMARKFKTGVNVGYVEGKPRRKDGADESWYIITYDGDL